MKLFRGLAAFAVLFLAICSILTVKNTTAAQAEEFGICTVSYIRSVSQIPDIPAGYTAHVTASGSGKNGAVSYFRFHLDADSWVCLSGNYSMYSHDGAGTHVDIFYDSGMGRKAGSFGWGYWQYDTEFTGFLPQGTYYISMITRKENYRDDFIGNVNITAVAVPVSSIFDFSAETGKKKNYAQVAVKDALGSYAKSVQYRRGAVDTSHIDDCRYWKQRATSGPDNAFILKADSGCYSFRVTENGPFTIMLEDTGGSRYSSVIHVFGIDRTKPCVTGVKNGRTYRKAVTVKFTDKQSGIRSAILNGRRISSGRRVSAPGVYKLTVIDQAENKISIKFRIRK